MPEGLGVEVGVGVGWGVRSDRVYLTLQLLLCGKCPTINAGHESHLALDRGSLFSAERGSCLEKILSFLKGGQLLCVCVWTYSAGSVR